MVVDIGEMLFREILGMSAYPGSPFTGNIFQDIILFFFVPTVFLIIFVYVASGIIVAPENTKLRLLFGIAIYAFIIASRYFEGFAIFASQFYFIFVIVIGLVYFLGRHFRRPGGGGTMAYEGRRGGAMPYSAQPAQHPHFESMSRRDLEQAEKRVRLEQKSIDDQIRKLEGLKDNVAAKTDIGPLLARKTQLDLELDEIRHQKSFVEKSRDKMGF